MGRLASSRLEMRLHRTYADITLGEQALGLARKKSSTTAYQAFTPHNMHRSHLYWNTAYPTGIVGIPRAFFLDLDECGIWLEKCNRKFGKAFAGVHVREPGPYGHAEKWTLIMAIDCSGRRWIRFGKFPGTTVEIFLEFINHILGTFPVGGPQRTFLYDNLRAHLHPSVFNAITFAGHQVVARPPYRPEWGPIEFVFNQLGRELERRIHSIADEGDFYREVLSILTNLNGFDATFVHCGYQ